ncbi:HNH endonuclease [Tsukamurella paurometabola]|nr:HNH endonuclease signature motif containing protein [Tsukamurella paurometabola]UEA85682.1 HNH endonuclease [Tsukamurella paurometabola]
MRATLATYGTRCHLRGPRCRGTATTADHLIPRSRNGPDTLDNLRPACQPCNRQRGDMTLTEWRTLHGRPTTNLAPSRNWLGDTDE